MILAAALSCLGLLAPGASAWLQEGGGTRTPLARVELEGPLSEVELGYPDGNAAVLAIPLRAGERRALSVPLPTPPGAPDAVPALSVVGAGGARFAGWVGSDRELLAAEWSRLPPGLRQRPRPPAPGQPLDPGPPPAALLVACAAFLLALRWRRRGWAALGVGAAGAAAAFALAARPAPVGSELSLLEGDGPSGTWLALRTARERLSVPPAEALWIQTRPPRAVLRARVEQAPGGLRWVLLARGATIDRIEVAPLGPDTLLRTGANRLGPLAETWLREPDGTWARHGPWPAGDPLPVALPGPGEPPGWINPALPMGVAILVARRPRPGHAGPDAWVRVVGF